MSDTISAQAITQWVHLSAQLLEQSQAEINRINVFPIPDADTGSNMAHTVRAASAEVDQAIASGQMPEVGELTDAHLAQLTALLATGAVKGARGNSGMVLSQVFRALSEATGRGEITARALVETLESAVRLVQQSISSPVEGTILTVLRESAAGARAALELNARLDQVAQACLQAAEKALAETPSQLPALAAAGVHDAGGAGFLLILEALTTVLSSPDQLESDNELKLAPVQVPDRSIAVEHESPRPGAELELMFLFYGPVEELRAILEAHGNSVIIAPAGTSSSKVHVHSTQPGTIIEEAFRLGDVSQLRIEVLPTHSPTADPHRVNIERPIIALVAEDASPAAQGEASGDIFATAGALSLGENAGDEAIAEAFAQMPQPEFAVLTNGSDPGAVQAVAQAHPKYTLHILDTSSQVAGLAALAVFDASKSWEANQAEMLDAAASQRWWQGSAQDAPAAVEELLAEGGELVTIISSTQKAAATVNDYTRAAATTHPEVEFHEHQALGLGDLVQVGVE